MLVNVVEFVGVLLGAFVGSTVACTIAHRGLTKKTKSTDPYECGCAHSLSFHDKKTNECHGVLTTQLYNSVNDKAGMKNQRCPCRRYVGDQPPPDLDWPAIIHSVDLPDSER